MDYVLNIIPQMMDGCLVSFQVFIITIVLSIPLGILLSLGRVSGIKPLQALIGGYVWILRGSPLMLQIFFVYFVLPSVGIRLPDFESAIVAFVLNYAAYFCEIFRAGIQAIPAGQYEAAPHYPAAGYPHHPAAYQQRNHYPGKGYISGIRAGDERSDAYRTQFGTA